MDYKLEIVLLLTIGFAFASLLGVIAARLKLPSILGFLFAVLQAHFLEIYPNKMKNW